MGKNLKMVRMRLDHKLVARLGKEYFDYPGSFQDSGFRCGTELMARYGPTSTVPKCNRIAGGDYYISHSDLMIHHLFKEKILPQRLKQHVKAAPPYFGDGFNIFVGLPVIKYLLAQKGIGVKGKPETASVEVDVCNRKTYSFNWDACRDYGGSYLRSAVYPLGILDITTSHYLDLMNGGVITAGSVFGALMDEVRSALPGLSQGDKLHYDLH